MCLAVPGLVVSVEGDELQRTGRVDFGGVLRDISFAYLPEARPGDYVLVHPQAAAGDGDIVVAVVDGEATVKRLRRTGGGVLLEAENPAFPPLFLPAPPDGGTASSPALRVAGKVVGLFRKM